MNYHRYFSGRREPVAVCLAGAGAFGRSFIAQSSRIPRIATRAAVDVTAETAVAAFRAGGIAAADIAVCRTEAEARAAWDTGRAIAADRLEVVLGLPIDVVIEATGHPEAGARHARLAIDAGRHVVMVSKEADSVVGPELARRARETGVVVTPVDGDQPSLLIGLVTWAETVGLDIVAAGKSSEYDFVFDPATETMTANGVTVPVPGFGALWELGARDVAELVGKRSAAAGALKQRTVPDLCEMLIVANATGLTFDRPDFHVPLARIQEVATVLGPRSAGGLIAGERRLDVFNCLRTAGELSFAGGVFVVVTCHDRETWTMLAEKGHTMHRDGRTAMLWLPRHLLGVEAATSVLEAAVLGRSSGAEVPGHVLDLAARADADLKAGTVLTASGHHHSIENVSGALVEAGALGDDRPVPFYLAANRPLVRDVRRGAMLTCGDVDLGQETELIALRRAQDRAFHGG